MRLNATFINQRIGIKHRANEGLKDSRHRIDDRINGLNRLDDRRPQHRIKFVQGGLHRFCGRLVIPAELRTNVVRDC